MAFRERGVRSWHVVLGSRHETFHEFSIVRAV
jgi:hypothetical protein